MQTLTHTPPAAITTGTRITELIGSFLSDQDIGLKSKAHYKRNIQQFFMWIEKKGHSLDTMKRKHIAEYKADMLNEGKSLLTIAAYLSAVRCFYTWAEASMLYPNIARGVKAPKGEKGYKRTPLTIEQTLDVLAHAKAKANTPAGIRDNAIMSLMLNLGLRTIEIVRLNIEDVVYKYGRRVIVLQRKGHHTKDGMLALPDDTFAAISAYLSTRGKPARGAMFVSNSNNNHGGRVDTHTISRTAKTLLKQIGINERTITAHSMRHTAAVNLLRSGASIQDAQTLLGHASVEMTMHYTKTINEEISFRGIRPEDMLQQLYRTQPTN